MLGKHTDCVGGGRAGKTHGLCGRSCWENTRIVWEEALLGKHTDCVGRGPAGKTHGLCGKRLWWENTRIVWEEALVGKHTDCVGRGSAGKTHGLCGKRPCWENTRIVWEEALVGKHTVCVGRGPAGRAGKDGLAGREPKSSHPWIGRERERERERESDALVIAFVLVHVDNASIFLLLWDLSFVPHGVEELSQLVRLSNRWANGHAVVRLRLAGRPVLCPCVSQF